MWAFLLVSQSLLSAAATSLCADREGEGRFLHFVGMAKGISPTSGTVDPGTQRKPFLIVKIMVDKSFDKNKSGNHKAQHVSKPPQRVLD